MAMTRYAFLTSDDAANLLNQGASLQQWLGVRESDGFRFIRWIEVDASGDAWRIYDKDSLDSGSPSDRDLTSFHNDNDPDSPEGMTYRCDSVDSVLAQCVAIGCSLDRFVRFCEIQHIYDEFVLANGPAHKGADQYFTRP